MVKYFKSFISASKFSTAVSAVVGAKLVILGISFLTSFILSLRAAVVTELVIPGILSSIPLILVLYTSFLTFLSTASLNLFKSTETGFNLPASNSANLSISNLLTADFKLAKSPFLNHSFFLNHSILLVL